MQTQHWQVDEIEQIAVELCGFARRKEHNDLRGHIDRRTHDLPFVQCTDFLRFVFLQEGDEQTESQFRRHHTVRLFEGLTRRDMTFVIDTHIDGRLLETDLGQIANLKGCACRKMEWRREE